MKTRLYNYPFEDFAFCEWYLEPKPGILTVNGIDIDTTDDSEG